MDDPKIGEVASLLSVVLAAIKLWLDERWRRKQATKSDLPTTGREGQR